MDEITKEISELLSRVGDKVPATDEAIPLIKEAVQKFVDENEVRYIDDGLYWTPKVSLDKLSEVDKGLRKTPTICVTLERKFI